MYFPCRVCIEASVLVEAFGRVISYHETASALDWVWGHLSNYLTGITIRIRQHDDMFDSGLCVTHWESPYV